MAEHTGDYEWRGEGEEAEIILFAPDEGAADPGIQRTFPAARLPGAESPVYAAMSPEGFGWVAASSTHAAPDLTSIPRRGVLLVADAGAGDLDVPPNEILSFLMRNLAEVSLPHLDGSGVRRMCESGAIAAAEDALIEEEDLDSFVSSAGDPDALGRRAISEGARDWEIRPRELGVKVVGETFDAEAAEELGLRTGTLVFVLDVGSGNLGRLALAEHRERIAGRDFGREGVPAAPVETEEAADLLSALGAISNFVDGRAALLVYALRRALSGAAGRLSIPAAWRVGGIKEDGGLLVHRNALAAVGTGGVMFAGGNVTVATGNMSGSAPPFGTPEDSGLWPWEEAGLMERLMRLGDPRG